MQAIRNAAADVLYGEPPTPVNIVLPRYGIQGTPQVGAAGWVLAGLAGLAGLGPRCRLRPAGMTAGATRYALLARMGHSHSAHHCILLSQALLSFLPDCPTARPSRPRPQVAGLDVGWGQQLDMAPDPRYQHRFLLQRELPPGCYTYKFVIVSRLSRVVCCSASEPAHAGPLACRGGPTDACLVSASACLAALPPRPLSSEAPPCCCAGRALGLRPQQPHQDGRRQPQQLGGSTVPQHRPCSTGAPRVDEQAGWLAGGSAARNRWQVTTSAGHPAGQL